MNQEELLKYATYLHREAFNANCYLSLLKQHNENCKRFSKEMKLSYIYYAVTYNALIDALYLNLAKLYETSGNTIGIKKLLEGCKNADLFLKEDTYSVPGFQDGEILEIEHLKEHQIAPDEECFFQEEIALHKLSLECLGYEKSTPALIKLRKLELIDLFLKKCNSMSKEIERLREMRNKIYAHNDTESILDVETIKKKNALDIANAQKLINLALDVCIFVIETLSGKTELRIHPCIDDWIETLEHIHID